ncbi:MAG TPA: hypothetical protein VEB69_00155 [Acidimicrobiia bacterium]|nr:hypothetical protein [Acidimicrobiia bacterium]
MVRLLQERQLALAQAGVMADTVETAYSAPGDSGSGPGSAAGAVRVCS